MAVRIPTCRHCATDMELGLMLDRGGRTGYVRSVWQAGLPERMKFLGMKTGTLKIDLKHALATITYRCTKCGYLESYAIKRES